MTNEPSRIDLDKSSPGLAHYIPDLNQPFVPPAGLPQPLLPMLPWGRNGLELLSARNTSLANTSGLMLPVSCGTVALAVGLLACGVKPEQHVAMPGYHCPRMVEAVLSVGAKPLLIDLTPELDYEQISAERAIDTGIAAFMLVNYFGRMPRNAQILANRCRVAAIPVIEDCAHADISLHGRCHGVYGQVAAYSLHKFYPLPEGGMVMLRDGLPLPQIDNPDLIDECRSAWRWMCGYGRQGMRRMLRGRNRDPVAVTPVKSSEGSASIPRITPAFPEQRRSTRVSGLLWRLYSGASCRERRWQNYSCLSRSLAEERSLELVDLDLSPEQTPYVLLARLAGEDPDRQYLALKRHRIPVWRWDRLYGKNCPQSRELGRRLVQFPIHQDLEAADMQWLADTIHKALLTV